MASGYSPASRRLAGPTSRLRGALTAERTGEVRARVRLMIEITARAGTYRKGLLAAAENLSPEEAAIISFSRDPQDRAKLVPSPRESKDVHGTLIDLLT